MRKLAAAVVLIVVWMWWHGRGAAIVDDIRPHAFVLGNRFGVVDGPETNRAMTILDRAGETVSKVELEPLASEVRVVGSGGGPAAVWIEGGKIRFQMIESDGSRGRSETFGTKATMLCEGAATNEQRFGVAWMEKDGRIWFVHGDGTASIEATAVASTDDTDDSDAPKPKWCAIASADEYIALAWPDGKKLAVNMCSRKRCEPTITSIKLDPTTVRGFGCVYNACLVATNDGAVSLFSMKGKKLWTRELPGARRGERTPVEGRDGRFVVAYPTDHGAIRVVRFDAKGDGGVLLDADGESPNLAMTRDRVVVAHRHRGDVVHHVMPLP